MFKSFIFRENLFRIWYWIVNKMDKNAEVLFMNYGYHDKKKPATLEAKNEQNRYVIQLYHQLASEVEIKDKEVVEIGCGRGGGLHYIMTNFSPVSALGIDLNKQTISFCNRHYKQSGLTFSQGNAQNLDLESEKCDIVINVESSHRYTDMTAFLKEVYRILKTGGFLLFTDFRYDFEMKNLKKELEMSRLKIVKERLINREVTSALELDDVRRRKLIKNLVPKFLHKIALNFAGTIGSDTYNKFTSNQYVYFSYILKKL